MIFSAILALTLGALTWTLLEYCIHRWLGHDARFRPNFFAAEHTRHHSEGNYFSPAWKKILAAGGILTLIGLPVYWFFGQGGGVYLLGIVLAYLSYEYIHYSFHVTSGRLGYWKRMRRHHFSHHFSNPRLNHGVTSPLWDYLFRTYKAPDLIRVPRKLQMCWLADAETGEVFPELSAWYELKGPL